MKQIDYWKASRSIERLLVRYAIVSLFWVFGQYNTYLRAKLQAPCIEVQLNGTHLIHLILSHLRPAACRSGNISDTSDK